MQHMQYVAEVTALRNERVNLETNYVKPARWENQRKVTVLLGHDYNSPVRGDITFKNDTLQLGQQVKVTIEPL